MVAMVFFESSCVRSWFPKVAGLEATGSLEISRVYKQVTGKELIVRLVGGEQGEVRVLYYSLGWSRTYGGPCGSASQVPGYQASILLSLTMSFPPLGILWSFRWAVNKCRTPVRLLNRITLNGPKNYLKQTLQNQKAIPSPLSLCTFAMTDCGTWLPSLGRGLGTQPYESHWLGTQRVDSGSARFDWES